MSRFAQKPAFGARVNRASDIARGLGGYWLLNEAGGMTVNDLTRSSQPGALHDNAARSKWLTGCMGVGLFGAGGEFDRVTIPDGSHLTFSSGDRISLSLWAKRETEAFSVPLASKDAPSSRQNWAIYFDNSNGVVFKYYSSGGAEQRWVSNSSLTGSPLRHIVFDYIYGTGSSATLYVDGVLNTGGGGGGQWRRESNAGQRCRRGLSRV
jgi:hypothetical protein